MHTARSIVGSLHKVECFVNFKARFVIVYKFLCQYYHRFEFNGVLMNFR